MKSNIRIIVGIVCCLIAGLVLGPPVAWSLCRPPGEVSDWHVLDGWFEQTALGVCLGPIVGALFGGWLGWLVKDSSTQ
jgi:hypothetical protein